MRRLGCALLVAAGIASPAAAAEPYARWRVDLSTSYSHLTRALPPWRETAAALTYRPNSADWLTGSVSQNSEFNVTDRVYAVSGVRTFAEGAFVGIGTGFTPAAHFRPRSSLRLSGQSAPLPGAGTGLRVSLAADLTTAEYRAGMVSSLQPALVVTHSRGGSLTARLIETRDEGGRWLSGYVLRIDAPLTRRMAGSLSFADAPESDLGVTVKSRALSAAALVGVDHGFNIRLSATQEWRRYFERRELSVGIVRAF